MRISAQKQDDNSCFFSVWAPEKKSMLLHIVLPEEKIVPMTRVDEGYFSVRVRDVKDGCRYYFKPDGENDYPDPASQYQPEGVHGPSEVVDHRAYKWNDQSWRGLPLSDMIIYELHVGTFTPEGTFEAVIPRLDDLMETGINSIELMPVSQFPGTRNWGYDGVFPYSVQNSYGGPDGLKKLVDSIHERNMAVILDVVYNHIGPEGNYFGMYGPYFTRKYRLPWGDAINYDDAWSDGVREFFSCNPLHWYLNYHIDGLRVDAIHTIYDTGAVHFWKLVHDKIKTFENRHGRKFWIIAESDYNSPKVVRHPEAGGYGFDAQWLDDFHHALYVLLHPEGRERYADFGLMEQLAKAYTDGFVHSGEYVKFRKRKHGASSGGLAGDKFIAFNQNHDQIGNRVRGERLSMLTGFRQMKMAAAALFLSPYVPMLFMGEEYGDENPFFYFVSHSDQNLIKEVRKGRKKEFEGYNWDADPPDPQSEETFLRSKIGWELRKSGRHKLLLNWNRELIDLRKTRQALRYIGKDRLFAYVTGSSGIAIHRISENGDDHVIAFFNFSGEELRFIVPAPAGEMTRILDSNEKRWNDSAGKHGIPAPTSARANEELRIAAWSVVVFGTKNSTIVKI